MAKLKLGARIFLHGSQGGGKKGYQGGGTDGGKLASLPPLLTTKQAIGNGLVHSCVKTVKS